MLVDVLKEVSKDQTLGGHKFMYNDDTSIVIVRENNVCFRHSCSRWPHIFVHSFQNKKKINVIFNSYH